jgi:chromosome segregation ATPase
MKFINKWFVSRKYYDERCAYYQNAINGTLLRNKSLETEITAIRKDNAELKAEINQLRSAFSELNPEVHDIRFTLAKLITNMSALEYIMSRVKGASK